MLPPAIYMHSCINVRTNNIHTYIRTQYGTFLLLLFLLSLFLLSLFIIICFIIMSWINEWSTIRPLDLKVVGFACFVNALLIFLLKLNL